MRAGARKSRPSSVPPTHAEIISQERHRGLEPAGLLDRCFGCVLATRSSSPRWSITPTWCRGSWRVSAPAHPAVVSASPTTAGSISKPLMPKASSTSAPRSLLSSPEQHFGTVNPVAEIVRVKAVGALTVLDGAQSVPHGLVGVADQAETFPGRPDRWRARVDFSLDQHKMLGPTASAGSGSLRPARRAASVPGRARWSTSSPWAPTTYAARRIASRPAPRDRAGRRGRCAVDYLTALGIGVSPSRAPDHRIRAWSAVGGSGLRVIGRLPLLAAALHSLRCPASTLMTPAMLLDERGIAVRVGQHCARPVCLRYGVPATTRMSAHVYTTRRN